VDPKYGTCARRCPAAPHRPNARWQRCQFPRRQNPFHATQAAKPAVGDQIRGGGWGRLVALRRDLESVEEALEISRSGSTALSMGSRVRNYAARLKAVADDRSD